jgi:hypothetical protein
MNEREPHAELEIEVQMPGPAPAPASATGPEFTQRLRAELDGLDVEDTELVDDLIAHVVAVIDAETPGAEPQATLSVDQAAAVAFSVLTGATSLPGPEGEVDGRRALALRRAEELAALRAEIVSRGAEDVASMSTVRLARAALRRRPRRRGRRNGQEETG